MISQQEIITLLSSMNVKITPQRIAVYEIISQLDHPYADEILQELKKAYPTIAKGTVYSILDFYCQHEIISKVRTSNGKMRYDPVSTNHHHIIENGSDKIADFTDDKLNDILQNYFNENPLPGYDIEEIKLQIQVKKSTNQ